ncbi:MAG TPA: transposase family protein [Propionibacteriaceae bacterium]|nr:transposase family protein [Propionibacteriaceae bacterium]
MSRSLARAAAVADRRVTGLSREVLAELAVELGPRGQACQDARLADRPRRRAIGAGARHRLVLLDRLPATLVHLRHRGTHDVLACWFGVPRSTITRAVGEVRPLAERGCTSRTASGCTPWPTWSPTSAPADNSACSMPPRCGCAARPPVGPVGAGSSRARPAPPPPRAWSHRP